MTLYFSSTSAALEYFAERAAIMEYDGGLSRSDAESAAMDEVAGKRKWLREEIRKSLEKSFKKCV